MDFVKILSDILSKNTSEEIREYLSKLKMTVPKEEFIKICENKSIDINLKIKNYIIQNGEEIIKIFDLIRKIKDEFYLLKKSFDTMKNQMLILKKKYIEPFIKLNKALTNKKNIEKLMVLFDKAKNFKEDIKILKSHYEKDTLSLSLQNFDIFLRLTQNNNSELKGIIYIKEEYDWFVMNKDNILNKFRQLFIKNVMNKNNDELLKYFELFSGMDILVSEIKDLSNKILKELMIENFLNKIIIKYINTIPLNTMDYNNINKIRKELNSFFDVLDNYSDIFDNLGKLLKNSYDKKNFVLYENIMEVVSIIFNNLNMYFIIRKNYRILILYL
jgi:hypothetical protein